MPESSRDFPLESIRNIGIIAHIDAGKTTCSERFLFHSGKIHRIGDIDNGTTVLDYLDEERARGITIVAAAASFEWAGRLVHLIDTPGHIDFTAEVERSLRVADGAVVVFSGVEGVEAQSEKVWRQSDSYAVPKIAFVNKLDRLGTSFQRVLSEIRAKFPGVKAAPFQIPAGSESALSGVVDLVSMKLLRFEGSDGEKVLEAEIPEELAADAKAARDEMLSSVSELSDAVADLYLSDKPVSRELFVQEARRLVIAGRLCPVLCGSAKRNIGMQPLLDAVCLYLPSPADRPPTKGVNPKSGEELDVAYDAKDFCGLVFKVVPGGSADLHYLRSYSGRLAVGDAVLNPRTGERVKVKRILRLFAKNVEPVDSIGPGDIVGLMGPQSIATGDTLCAVNRPVALERIKFPEPVISVAVEPKSSKDKDRLDECLAILCREDPTLKVKIHEATGQRLLSGMGELHLEVKAHRIRDEFKLEARCGAPQVAFRETLSEPCELTGIFDKVLGEATLFAEVDFSLEPVPKLERGLDVSLSLKGSIPHAWRLSAGETLLNALRTGGNWGYPLVDIKAVVTDIRGDPERTTEASVAGAVLDGVRQAIAKGTVLLEPLMRLEIVSPEDCVGEVSGFLQSKRAVIHGMDSIPGARRLLCEVPLSEMFGLGKSLPKLSAGRASFSMEPCGYQRISPEQLQRCNGAGS